MVFVCFFWVIPRRLNFIRRNFEPNPFPYKYPNILNPIYSLYLPACEDGTECFETSGYKIQTPGNYPEESRQHLEHGEKFQIKKNIVDGDVGSGNI
jgi:hypothetical protein